MADIRIKDLATTAASTASDDFLAVDGSANGTRKLNAYSPTFGGNLTVSGTGNSQINGNLGIGSSPSSWGSAYKAIELSNNGSLSYTVNSLFAINNAYFNGSNWVFNTNGYALSYQQNKNNGGHDWYSSNSGTAGGTPTFALLATLTRDGNLILNSTGTDGGQKLQVSGTASISGGIVGTTTNDSAAAGIVGELISATDNTGVSLTTGTRVDVVSISLTAGDWDVTGYVGYLPSGGASSTYQEGSISATSATIGSAGARTLLKMTTTAQVEFPIPTVRVSLSGTTTYYLVTNNDFTGGTMKGTGIIRARRVR